MHQTIVKVNGGKWDDKREECRLQWKFGGEKGCHRVKGRDVAGSRPAAERIAAFMRGHIESSDSPVAFQWRSGGVPVAFRWRSSGVPVACQWRARGVPAELEPF